MVGKSRENNWDPNVTCRKCQSSAETMEHLVYHCHEMAERRMQLIGEAMSLIPYPDEGELFGAMEQHDQLLMMLGKDVGWKVVKEAEFWKKMVGCWREFVRVYCEG